MKLLWQIDTQVDPRYLSLMQTAADCACGWKAFRVPAR